MPHGHRRPFNKDYRSVPVLHARPDANLRPKVAVVATEARGRMDRTEGTNRWGTGQGWMWLALCVVAAMGAVLDVMEVDAAQYAIMARDMLAQEDPLKLYFRGRDYLDKPPLLFWSSAISYALFGVHAWSYKLPSILFAFLGIWSTYRYARLFHPHPTARIAALIYGSTAAFLLMTNDVRTDTMLAASVMTGIWTGAEWLQRRTLPWLLYTAVAIAAGMLAKGPMGLVAPVVALGAQVLLTRQWWVLRDARVLLVPVLIALLLLPMCIGLYEQHGAHGLRFYFWEQSFGRITGENRWKDDSTFLYFAHEVPWLMLPWTVFVLAGVAAGIMRLVRRQVLPDYGSLVGSVVLFVALSLSQFKLPHYLYPIVPLLAIVGASAFGNGLPAWLQRAHLVLLSLVWLLAMALVGWSFPEGSWPFVLLLLIVPAMVILLTRSRSLPERVLPITFWTWCALAFALNGHVYPHVLKYQANAQVGRWVAAEGIPVERFLTLRTGGTALEFYAARTGLFFHHVNAMPVQPLSGTYVYTDAEGLAQLRARGWAPTIVREFPNYPVQLPGLDLLVPARRRAAMEIRFLLIF
jgi:4-amino-4-deoxy-L-arabinose transferase-like glycosyltransferase